MIGLVILRRGRELHRILSEPCPITASIVPWVISREAYDWLKFILIWIWTAAALFSFIDFWWLVNFEYNRGLARSSNFLLFFTFLFHLELDSPSSIIIINQPSCHCMDNWAHLQPLLNRSIKQTNHSGRINYPNSKSSHPPKTFIPDLP